MLGSIVIAMLLDDDKMGVAGQRGQLNVAQRSLDAWFHSRACNHHSLLEVIDQQISFCLDFPSLAL